MFRKTLFSLVWFVLLWIGSLMIGSAVAGGIAGAKADSQNSIEAGAQAGSEFDEKYAKYLLIISAIAAGAGSITGVLPGTKMSQNKSKFSSK